MRSLSRLRERVGERVSPQRDNPQEDRTLTRAFSATSPASGRGAASPWRDCSAKQSHLRSTALLQRNVILKGKLKLTSSRPLRQMLGVSRGDDRGSAKKLRE